MFNDERINTESGKIYRLGILLATLFVLAYGGLRCARLSLIGEIHIKYLFTESFTVISGTAILLIGEIRRLILRGEKGDERVAYETNSYYLVAGKVFLALALSGYALSIPFSIRREFNDIPTNYIILMLELLGFIYFSCTFKRRGISFNYTFIDEPKGRYNLRVFANIGKLALILALPFSLAIVLEFCIFGSLIGTVAILIAYVCSVIGIGFEYLLLSWIEKLDYDDVSNRFLTLGSIVVYVIFFAVLIANSITYISYAYFYTKGAEGWKGFYSYADIVASFSTVFSYFGYAVGALTVMLISYVTSELRKSKTVRLAALGSTLSIGIKLAFKALSSPLSLYLIELIHDDAQKLYAILEIINKITYVLQAANAVFILIMIIGLVCDVGVSKKLMLVPAAFAVTGAAAIYLNTQNLVVEKNIIECICKVLALITSFVILIKFKHKGEETPTI